MQHKIAKKRLCCVLCVKQQQKYFGNIRIPKTGMKFRIYPEHIQEYRSFLDKLPGKVTLIKAKNLQITVIKEQDAKTQSR